MEKVKKVNYRIVSIILVLSLVLMLCFVPEKKKSEAHAEVITTSVAIAVFMAVAAGLGITFVNNGLSQSDFELNLGSRLDSQLQSQGTSLQAVTLKIAAATAISAVGNFLFKGIEGITLFKEFAKAALNMVRSDDFSIQGTSYSLGDFPVLDYHSIYGHTLSELPSYFLSLYNAVLNNDQSFVFNFTSSQTFKFSSQFGYFGFFDNASSRFNYKGNYGTFFYPCIDGSRFLFRSFDIDPSSLVISSPSALYTQFLSLDLLTSSSFTSIDDLDIDVVENNIDNLEADADKIVAMPSIGAIDGYDAFTNRVNTALQNNDLVVGQAQTVTIPSDIVGTDAEDAYVDGVLDGTVIPDQSEVIAGLLAAFSAAMTNTMNFQQSLYPSIQDVPSINLTAPEKVKNAALWFVQKLNVYWDLSDIIQYVILFALLIGIYVLVTGLINRVPHNKRF